MKIIMDVWSRQLKKVAKEGRRGHTAFTLAFVTLFLPLMSLAFRGIDSLTPNVLIVLMVISCLLSAIGLILSPTDDIKKVYPVIGPDEVVATDCRGAEKYKALVMYLDFTPESAVQALVARNIPIVKITYDGQLAWLIMKDVRTSDQAHADFLNLWVHKGAWVQKADVVFLADGTEAEYVLHEKVTEVTPIS